MLLHDEVERRAQSKLRLRLRRAAFDPSKSLESFDFAFNPKVNKAQIFDQGGSFRVVFTYGRVGQAGQVQTLVCGTLDHARRELNSKVKAKVAKGYTRPTNQKASAGL